MVADCSAPPDLSQALFLVLLFNAKDSQQFLVFQKWENKGEEKQMR